MGSIENDYLGAEHRIVQVNKHKIKSVLENCKRKKALSRWKLSTTPLIQANKADYRCVNCYYKVTKIYDLLNVTISPITKSNRKI